MEHNDSSGIRDWFATWDKQVDAIDFVSARALFEQDVIGFGTRMDVVKGLSHLERHQWRKVWPTIKNFKFELDTLECLFSPDRLQCVGIIIWTSTGYSEDKTPFKRNGRATVVFNRIKTQNIWKATHTHISLNPGTPSPSYGNRQP